MKVLVIAPHQDDELIGVGGTIAKRVFSGDTVKVCVVTKGVPPLFSEEISTICREECLKAAKLLGVDSIEFLNHPAVMLEDVPRYKLNQNILDLIMAYEPDEVYIPHRGDMQIDHQIVVDAAMVALRPKYKHKVSRVYAYETLSETGWNIPNVVNEFIPNVYEDITEYFLTKMEGMKQYQSQLSEFPSARSLQAIEALAMFRGATIGVKYAEAFSLVREIK